MRRTDRTTKRGIIFPILYPSRITTPPYRTNLPTKLHRLTKYTPSPILIGTPKNLMKRHHFMTSVHNSLHSKNTPTRATPVTPQSTRRSTDCRLNSPCGHPTKTRRLRHTTNHHNTNPNHKLHGIPLPNIIPLRHNYD